MTPVRSAGLPMQFDINFERDEVYECGALLLTVLVCPEDVEKSRSSEIFRSLCGHALWLRYQVEPDDWTPVTVKPQYVFRDRKIVERDLAIVVKRLGERMVAGRMAIAFFQRSLLGEAAQLPKEIKRLSVNQMAEFVLEDAGQADVGNLKRRVWAPSLPVIHLAAAAAIAAQRLLKAREMSVLERFLFDPAHVAGIVRHAEDLEAMIAADAKIPVRADQLIRFRVI
jgi:hypothetical protein